MAPNVAPQNGDMSNDETIFNETKKKPQSFAGCGFCFYLLLTAMQFWRTRRDSCFNLKPLRLNDSGKTPKKVAPYVAPALISLRLRKPEPTPARRRGNHTKMTKVFPATHHGTTERSALTQP